MKPSFKMVQNDTLCTPHFSYTFFWWVNRVAIFCSTWYQVFTYYFTQLVNKPMELIINFGLLYKPNTQIDFKT